MPSSGEASALDALAFGTAETSQSATDLWLRARAVSSADAPPQSEARSRWYVEPYRARGALGEAAHCMQVLISAPTPHSRYVAAARSRVALGEAAAAEDLLLSVLSSRQRAEYTVQAEYAA